MVPVACRIELFVDPYAGYHLAWANSLLLAEVACALLEAHFCYVWKAFLCS